MTPHPSHEMRPLHDGTGEHMCMKCLTCTGHDSYAELPKECVVTPHA